MWVYNVVLSYVHNNEDAEEVVQDTLLAALKGIDRFKNESSLKTWVYSIAINKSKDVLKYKSRKKRIGHVISISRNEDSTLQDIQPVNFTHPGVELESKEKMDILFTAINQLPENQKQAIILARLDQMPMKQIAEVMGTTVKAVESMLSRARANLRSYLESEGIRIYKNKK